MANRSEIPKRPMILTAYVEDDADERALEALEEVPNIRIARGTHAREDDSAERPDVIDPTAQSPIDSLSLLLDAGGLALVGGGEVLRGDFARMRPRTAPNRLHRELLVRAAKIKSGSARPMAVDATAGLGEDSFLLAAAGFDVQLYERDPVIAALLQDTLRRAAADPDLAPIVARMDLRQGDSLVALPYLQHTPDVVLLDPMFPARRKSAAVKKKFQLLQQLELPCDDEVALLDAALAAHPHKIVVKRPLKGPWLADRKPDYALKGSSIRYDCIVLA